MLLAMPTPPARAVAPPTGPFFLCVNTTAKPPLPNARVVTSMSSCLPFEYLVDLNTNPTNALSVQVVCMSSSVAAGGNFNQQATCPMGDIVIAGGYACTDTNGDLLSVTVEENTFVFGAPGGVTPIGWQTVGFNNNGEASGSCNVCVTCAPGACKNLADSCGP
jgi:hypothetical protein